MIHSGLRPYFCAVCNVGFKQSSALQGHVQSAKHKRALELDEEKKKRQKTDVFFADSGNSSEEDTGLVICD